MLDSKVDKQIKRYLKSISDKKTMTSKVNGSSHYFMTTEQGTFEVRFGDHFSESGQKADFDIVKVRNLYIIRFEEIQYSLYEEDALIYIKALFLIGPEMSKQLTESRKQAKDYLNKWVYYKSKWNKYQDDIKFMNDIWSEKEKTDKENKKLKEENKILREGNSKGSILERTNKELLDKLKATKEEVKTLQKAQRTLKLENNQLMGKIKTLRNVFKNLSDD